MCYELRCGRFGPPRESQIFGPPRETRMFSFFFKFSFFLEVLGVRSESDMQRSGLEAVGAFVARDFGEDRVFVGTVVSFSEGSDGGANGRTSILPHMKAIT